MSADRGRAPRYALMWSGGKDSALALARARERGLEVGALLNFIDGVSGRVRFHATRAGLIAAQAMAAEVPLRQIATSWDAFDVAFRAELERLRDEGFTGVVFGDIHLADVRAWYEERVTAPGLGARGRSPAVGRPPFGRSPGACRRGTS